MYKQIINKNKHKINNKITIGQALDKITDYIYKEIDICNENFIRESALRLCLKIIRENKNNLSTIETYIQNEINKSSDNFIKQSAFREIMDILIINKSKVA